MKRYIAQPGDWAMAERFDGGWVRYEEVCQTLEELQQRIRDLEMSEDERALPWNQEPSP